MGLFGKPNVKKMMENKDINGLNKSLNSKDKQVVIDACNAIAELAGNGIGNESSILYLNQILEKGNIPFTDSILTLSKLAVIGIADVSSIPILKKLLAEGDREIQISSSIMLGLLAKNGKYDISVIPIINDILKKSDRKDIELVKSLFFTLGRMAEKGAVDKDSLTYTDIAMEEGIGLEVKIDIVMIIARLAEKGIFQPASLDILNDALAHDEQTPPKILLKNNAAYALTRYTKFNIFNERTIELLKKAMDSSNESLRTNAKEALEEMGILEKSISNAYDIPLGEPAIEILKRNGEIELLNKMLKNPKDSIRSNTCYALGQLANKGHGNSSSLAPLIKALSDDSIYVRNAAAYALDFLARLKIGDSSSIPLLNALLTEDDSISKDMSSHALASLADMDLGDNSSLPLLNMILEKADPWTKSGAAMAISSLAKIGIGNRSSIPLLNLSLKNDNLMLKLYSTMALGNLAEIGILDESSRDSLDELFNEEGIDDTVQEAIDKINANLGN